MQINTMIEDHVTFTLICMSLCFYIHNVTKQTKYAATQKRDIKRDREKGRMQKEE